MASLSEDRSAQKWPVLPRNGGPPGNGRRLDMFQCFCVFQRAISGHFCQATCTSENMTKMKPPMHSKREHYELNEPGCSTAACRQRVGKRVHSSGKRVPPHFHAFPKIESEKCRGHAFQTCPKRIESEKCGGHALQTCPKRVPPHFSLSISLANSVPNVYRT